MTHTCVEMNSQNSDHAVNVNCCLGSDLVAANRDCYLLEMHYKNRSVCQTFRTGRDLVRQVDFGLVHDRTGSDHHHMGHYQTGHHGPCSLSDPDLNVIFRDHIHKIVRHNDRHLVNRGQVH